MKDHRTRPWPLLLLALLASLAAAQPADPGLDLAPIDYVEETLDNGLRVIYAPLRQAPVVHVRVLYHVGSKDERPDRQGFAHMFEHMMFRGSAHVEPEEHGRLVNLVGGYANAYTSFDETVYVNTVPSNQLEMVLWLEADRMASFKVSEEIFGIERNVVKEEWRRRVNQPYGTFFDTFMGLAYKVHPYRWTPIGVMEHLEAADAPELQAFFNRFYVPNNAALVIAGDIDIEQARAMVRRYFGWIPRGEPVPRALPAEPELTEPRRMERAEAVPLPRIMVGYPIPPYESDDHYALTLLSHILGGTRSSRLDNLLVNSANPLAVAAGTYNLALEEGGFFGVVGIVLAGREPAEVEAALQQAVADVVAEGVTAEELAKAKMQEVVDSVQGLQTAEDIAARLGDETLFGNDPARVNEALAKIQAVTPADVQAVARKYLVPTKASTLVVAPPSADAPVAEEMVEDEGEDADPAGDAAAGEPLAAEPREVTFPEGYPTEPPIADARVRATFSKGVSTRIGSTEVIVMPDHRLPLVTWGLTLRTGSHADPEGKEGTAELTADLLRRGAAGLSYTELNEDLESRGISIGISDGGDFTRLSGSSLTGQLDHAMLRSRQILLEPTLPADEFARLKEQTLNVLRLAEAEPETAANRVVSDALYGGSAVGKYATSATVANIELDDVKAFYDAVYHPSDAIFVIAGDITVERGQQLAAELLEGWGMARLPTVHYTLEPRAPGRRIVVVDRPDAQQSLIRMGTRAYSLQSSDKFAGSLAGQLLSAGLDSRLAQYVRAEKGLAYSVWGYFDPNRYSGDFTAGTETDVSTTAAAIEAILTVLGQVADGAVTADELDNAKLRVVGSMVMGLQTIQQQAEYRVAGILNGYPLDYYDTYPEKVAGVTPEQIAAVIDRYVTDDALTIVVVAPAEAVREQLEPLGTVEVVPMPAGVGE